MEDNLPDDLRSDIREVSAPLVESLQTRGWRVGVIQWENQTTRSVSFVAKTSKGEPVHVSCGEEDLPNRLKKLLESS